VGLRRGRWKPVCARGADRAPACGRSTSSLDVTETHPGKLEVNVISRQWRGLAQPDQAQNYVQHLRTEAFPALRKLPGFVSASILSRRLGDGIEFLIVTQWDSLDAIARFAGPDLEAAVVHAGAAEMMIEYDRRVRHFEVIE
jgi:heme-degrading monooxygenase HmoA